MNRRKFTQLVSATASVGWRGPAIGGAIAPAQANAKSQLTNGLGQGGKGCGAACQLYDNLIPGPRSDSVTRHEW